MRKHTYPPEFEKLTPEEIKILDLWLEEHPYRVAQEKLAAEFGVLISINKLCRYLQHRELAEEINDETDLNLSARELYQVLNGDPVPYDEATLHLIAKQVFFQALKPDLSLSKLALIHRLATYKQTIDIKQRRLALEETRRGIAPASPSSQPAPAARSIPAASAPVPAMPSAQPAAPATPPATSSPVSVIIPSPIEFLLTPSKPPVEASPEELAKIAALLPATPLKSTYFQNMPIAA